MKVAITGGNGFLGKYVLNQIKYEDMSPLVLTRSEKVIGDNEISTDYSKESLLTCLNGANAVVHLAAKRGSDKNADSYIDNITMTQNIYEACIELGISNIVYASTISIYSDQSILPWIEIQKTTPVNMYGIVKQACENLGEYYSKQTSLKIKNLRFAHLYGFKEQNDYMINRFMKRAFNHEQLQVNACLGSNREFLYAKDAASAVICALKQESKSGVYNIGSEEALTNYDVAKTINEVFDNPNELKVEYGNNIEPSYMISNFAQKELNYQPEYNFKGAITEIYNLLLSEKEAE